MKYQNGSRQSINMRVKFPLGQQQTFLENIQRLTGASTTDLASRIGVCARTMRDWRRERWQMDEQSLDRLCQLANLPKPTQIIVLPEHWSTEKASRLGGLRRVTLYGSPGTAEGRRRGGLAAQATLNTQARLVPRGGWKVRKTILIPAHSEKLAEFFGIMLGDGCIRNGWQVGISFNQHGDQPYALFIQQLIKQLFGLEASCVIRPSSADLVISSVALVDFLREHGFPAGSKCETLTEVPGWIRDVTEFRVACLRGLMDTDGCVFRHRYRVNGKEYSYPKLGFAAAISCLTQFVAETFRQLALRAHIHQQGQRVFVYSWKDVIRYFEVVGTHNPRYQQRFESYAKQFLER